MGGLFLEFEGGVVGDDSMLGVVHGLDVAAEAIFIEAAMFETDEGGRLVGIELGHAPGP